MVELPEVLATHAPNFGCTFDLPGRLLEEVATSPPRLVLIDQASNLSPARAQFIAIDAQQRSTRFILGIKGRPDFSLTKVSLSLRELLLSNIKPTIGFANGN